MKKSWNMFVIDKVCGDNACFYRAIANQLCYRSIHWKSRIILSKHNRWETKSLEEMRSLQETWGYGGSEQTQMAKVLQQWVRRWIYKHRDDFIPCLGVKVNDYVSMIHDLKKIKDQYPGWDNVDVYNEVYKAFAGKKGETDQDRWGSALEQWALSEMFQVPVVVWEIRRWKDGKQVRGSIRRDRVSRSSFYKEIQRFGRSYTRPPLNILYDETRRSKHYYGLLEEGKS